MSGQPPTNPGSSSGESNKIGPMLLSSAAVSGSRTRARLIIGAPGPE